jgi:hypothetical protein
VLKAFRFDTYRRLLRGEVAVFRIFRRLMLGEGGISARAVNGSHNRRKRNLKESKRDIQRELGDYNGRLCFIYGAADAEGISGWRSVLEPFLRAKGVSYRQAEIKGADHDFHGLAVKGQAIAAVIDFLTGTGRQDV